MKFRKERVEMGFLSFMMDRRYGPQAAYGLVLETSW